MSVSRGVVEAQHLPAGDLADLGRLETLEVQQNHRGRWPAAGRSAPPAARRPCTCRAPARRTPAAAEPRALPGSPLRGGVRADRGPRRPQRHVDPLQQVASPHLVPFVGSRGPHEARPEGVGHTSPLSGGSRVDTVWGPLTEVVPEWTTRRRARSQQDPIRTVKRDSGPRTPRCAARAFGLARTGLCECEPLTRAQPCGGGAGAGSGYSRRRLRSTASLPVSVRRASWVARAQTSSPCRQRATTLPTSRQRPTP